MGSWAALAFSHHSSSSSSSSSCPLPLTHPSHQCDSIGQTPNPTVIPAAARAEQSPASTGQGQAVPGAISQAPHSHLPKGWEEGGHQMPSRRELLTTPGQQLPSLGPSPGRPRESLGNLSALRGWAGGPLPAASLPGAGLCPKRGSPAAGSKALLRTQCPGIQGHGAAGQMWAACGHSLAAILFRVPELSLYFWSHPALRGVRVVLQGLHPLHHAAAMGHKKVSPSSSHPVSHGPLWRGHGSHCCRIAQPRAAAARALRPPAVFSILRAQGGEALRQDTAPAPLLSVRAGLWSSPQPGEGGALGLCSSACRYGPCLHPSFS